MTRLRILEIASELPPVTSGVARSAGTVVEGLRSRGHEVVCLSAADAPRFSAGEFRFSALWSRWLRLNRLVDGFDLVHLTGPSPFIADTLLARWKCSRASLPPLVYTHGFDLVLEGMRPPSLLYQRVLSGLMTAADVVVTTTPGYADHHRRFAKRMEVIPWAAELPVVEADIADRPTNGVLRVVFVGQHRPYKGTRYLIDAARGADQLEVRMIGGGPDLDADRAYVQTTGASNVAHLGPLSDQALSAELANADVVCLPSVNESEAFGIVLLEGMAAGCAAVATDLRGVKDVVGDGGLLVPPKDSVALRAALLRLAGDPDLLARLKRAATENEAMYSWDRTITLHEDLYLELVSER